MKRIFALLLAVAMLCGCQLATVEEKMEPMGDQLAGVFITFEYLDLFEMEAYLEDNLDEILDGETIVEDPQGYSRTIPAVLDEDGWSFPGIDGICMGQFWEDGHWHGFVREGISNIQTHHTSTETLEGIREVGTIYVPAGTEVMLYCNPVYMTPEGRYYTTEAQGLGSLMTEGTMTQSIRDEKTWTEGSETRTYEAEFVVNVEAVELAEQVIVVQMSADHQELSRVIYQPEELPEIMVPEADAAYLIFEETLDGQVKRTLIQPGDDAYEVYRETEYVYCLPRFVTIVWGEVER